MRTVTATPLEHRNVNMKLFLIGLAGFVAVLACFGIGYFVAALAEAVGWA